jgi:hypothetical protein
MTAPYDLADDNRLPVLAAAIDAAHHDVIAADEAAVSRGRDAGLALIEAKGRLAHGDWLPWVKSLGISPRTAQVYMQLGRLPESKCARVAHLAMRRVLRQIAAWRAARLLPSRFRDLLLEELTLIVPIVEAPASVRPPLTDALVVALKSQAVAIGVLLGADDDLAEASDDLARLRC